MPSRSHDAAFEELVRRHHAEVYRAAMRVLGDEGAARDATQEVFLGLLGGRSASERALGARDVGAVLRRRAVQRALARMGSERRRRRREKAFAMQRPEAFEEDPVERGEVRDRVARLLARLPGELRAALALRFGEDLTFAAIAELTGCSEPTAHDRVRRGLERLRGDLGRAGLAGLAPGLPEMLSRLDPPPIPAGLEQTLLGLAAVKPALSIGAAVALAVAGVATAVLAGAALLPARPGAGGELAQAPPVLEPAAGLGGSGVTAELAPASEPEPEGARVALAASPASPGAPGAAATAAPSEARVTGRLRDELGRPVAGARVELLGNQPGLKVPLAERSTQSAADGSFELAHAPQGHPYLLLVEAHGRLEHRTGVFELGPGAVRDLGELRLLPDSADPEGEFTLTLFLVDDAAAPVADALVVLERRKRRTRPTEHREEGGYDIGDGVEGLWTWHREASGRTDEAGRIVLAGDRLGTKRVRARPMREHPAQATSGAAPAAIPAPGIFELAIDLPGVHERTLALEAGLAIEGRIRTVDGVPLPDDLSNALVALPPDGVAWLHGHIAPDGSFHVGGLTDEPHELRLWMAGISPLTLPDVVPGGEPLELLLKRADDPRPLGQHDAEIHGEVLDARTGEPVEVGPFDVQVELLGGEERAMSPAELLAHRRGRPRQSQQQLEESGEPALTHELHRVGLRPGTYALWVETPGYERTLVGIFELARGELVAGVQARIAPKSSEPR